MDERGGREQRENQEGLEVCLLGEAGCLFKMCACCSRIGPPSSPTGGDKEENPAALAENCFRELLARATYGNMNNAVKPVFA